jgi:hypothetical protein
MIQLDSNIGENNEYLAFYKWQVYLGWYGTLITIRDSFIEILKNNITVEGYGTSETESLNRAKDQLLIKINAIIDDSDSDSKLKEKLLIVKKALS